MTLIRKARLLIAVGGLRFDQSAWAGLPTNAILRAIIGAPLKA
jgi:hypothetical protein